MINIRRGVFETNSSSSHSIVVMKDSQYETEEYFNTLCEVVIEYDEELVQYIKSGEYRLSRFECDLEFGRSPFTVLDDFRSKLRYAIAYYQDDEDKIKEIMEVLKKYTGCTKIVYPYTWNKDEAQEYKGYIDHQSIGILDSLINSGVSIEEFLTNRKYFVVIDGDEYDEWAKLKSTGVVNKDKIEKEFD